MNIILVCNAGMSTGIMKMKLEQESVKRNLDASVQAIPMSDLDSHIDEADVILLGPQIRFAFSKIKSQAKDKFVMTIEPQDFGTMNAPKVMDEIEKNLK